MISKLCIEEGFACIIFMGHPLSLLRGFKRGRRLDSSGYGTGNGKPTAGGGPGKQMQKDVKSEECKERVTKAPMNRPQSAVKVRVLAVSCVWLFVFAVSWKVFS